MKILHTADLHLDSKLRTHLTGDKAKIRKTELLETFRRMVSYADTNKISHILIAGDLFDTTLVSKTTQNVVKSEIENHPDINFYYLKGNHDIDSFLSSYETIPLNLFLFDDEWKQYYLSDNTVLYGVELSSENAANLYAELVTDVEKINIVMLHGQDSAYSQKDKAEVIALNNLKNKGIDYLALGHIHSYKKEALDGRGYYCYPGCPEGRGFDECGECGFVVIDIDEDKKELNTEFIPFAKRKLYKIYVDVSGIESTPEAEDLIESKLNALKETESNINESLIEIVLSGNVSIDTEIDTLVLTSFFSEDYFFLKVKDETGIGIDYTLFEKDESLKGEFVRLVKDREEISDEDKNLIIKTGIGLLSGEKPEV